MEGLFGILSDLKEFENVPADQVKWMVDNGFTKNFNKGEFAFEPGDPINELRIILDGKFLGYGIQNGQRKEFGYFEKNLITGVLPYSRLKDAGAYAEALEPSNIFYLHKDHFPHMIRECHELTTALVHFMTSRVRDFTAFQLQNEKLMSLGKLSAGLAHELNNPVSAILRSAVKLKEHLRLLPKGFKDVIKIRISDEQVDKVNSLLFKKIDVGIQELSLMEKTDLEDEIAGWLEDNGIEDGYDMAENLVDFGFKTDELEMIKNEVTEAHSLPILNWIENNLTTEKMVDEIADASERISDLVKSIKSYTHMDQSLDRQKVDLHKGLRNTLRMLEHKSKKKGMLVDLNLDENLPEIDGFPGELNQVFTNLIDNAFDAMEESSEKVLNIATHRQNGNVHVHIKDTGPGIPEEIKSRIFDPFFTTKDVGKGTGLGLDIVKKIIEQHKGRIEFNSSTEGTEFKLILPISS
jgi:signal transduction histidine kinase